MKINTKVTLHFQQSYHEQNNVLEEPCGGSDDRGYILPPPYQQYSQMSIEPDENEKRCKHTLTDILPNSNSSCLH